MEPQHNHSNQEKDAINHLGQIAFLNIEGKEILYYKNPVILNQQYSKDIIPGVYEGGFQLWECEIQFLKKIFELKEFQHQLKHKSVIQIGCGHGLLAIAADKLGASSITLQDYNENVIQQLTKSTIHINNVKCQVKYLWGDWDSIKNQGLYDIILGSQVTYKEQNYEKIINFILNNMNRSGKCILANKSYYFGVGGNLASFKQKVEERGLEWTSISKIVPKSGGNKKEIIQIHFKNPN